MLSSDESKWWNDSNLQRDIEMHILSLFVGPSGKQQGKLCLQPIPHAQRQMWPSAKFQQRQLCFFLEFSWHFSKETVILGNSNYIVARDEHQGQVIGQVHELETLVWSFYHKRLQNTFISWQKAQKHSSTSNPETLRWLTCVHPSISLDAQGKQLKHQARDRLAKWMQNGSTTWTWAIAPSTNLLGTSLSASLLTFHKISPLLAEVWPTSEHYW